MQFEETSTLSIDDYMRDDTLLKVTSSGPWYANLVNYLVAGYIPPEVDKKKLIHDSRFYLLDDLYCTYTNSMLTVSFVAASQSVKLTISWIVANLQIMVVIM